MFVQSYKTKEEVPEGLRDHYEEKEGSWVISGFVSKNKLDEFRTNNRSLAKERTELQDQLLKFKDIDPAKYAEAVEKLASLENDRLAEAGEWKVLKANLDQSHSDAMKVEQGKTKTVQNTLNGERINNATATIVFQHAIPKEGNMKYVQSDIRNAASIDPETNEIVFLDDKGVVKKNEANDGNLGLEEYLTKTYIPKSNLFSKSEGAGGLGGKNIPFVSKGQVKFDSISGQDISGDMLESIADGKVTVVE